MEVMSANLEKAIQEEIRRLTDQKQQQVMAFVESLEAPTGPPERPTLFVYWHCSQRKWLAFD
jgi:hypothetical protein